MEKKMSYFVFAFLIALLVFDDHILVGKADNECADGYEKHEDSCYYLSMPSRAARVTRAEAAAACRPGHLADIASEEEQDYIVNLLIDNGRDEAWFGLVKSLSWSDGSSLVHESWQNILADERQPERQRCFLVYRHFKEYIWNDIGCDESHKSICEYEISGNEECRSGFIKYNGSCYQINNNTLNRTDAVAACGAELAHLVDITSEEEHQSVGEMLTLSGEEFAWIGLTLSDPPSWSDGSLLSPGNWYEIITDGQSVCYRLQDQGSEGEGYRWDDTPDSKCQDRYRYVCEIEVNSTTSESQDSTTLSTISFKRSTTDNKAFTETSSYISTSISNSTVVLGMQEGNTTGAIVGSLFGVALLIVAIAAVTWFVLRQRKRNNPKSQSPGKIPSVVVGTTKEPEHNNPTYAIDADATTEIDSHQYNTVHDQTGEYTYIESNASGKGDEHIYAETAVDRKSSHTSNRDSPDEGWKENTVYVTSDGTAKNNEE